MFPQAKFLMFFIVPMPAWVAVGGIFAVSHVSLISRNKLLNYVFLS
jgi:hypothetical protein